jgi:RNA ligase (TIGR02306 family)
MSDTPVEVARISAIEPHPNADRLEIAKVLNTQFITQKGNLKPEDLVVYFPPDMLIPESVAKKLGVDTYLKHAVMPGEFHKTKCRIGAIRLRGVASFGFGLPLTSLEVLEFMGHLGVASGLDLSEAFSAVKYQPPCRLGDGQSLRQPGSFHKYTNIQHYYRNANKLEPGTPVRITEKLHGTNSRVGYIQDDGHEMMCGTHHRRVKQYGKLSNMSVYWTPMTDDMAEMLEFISIAGQHNVIVFGEIYGQGVQKMDYGTVKGSGYRVFDISIDGEYQDWVDVKAYCELYGIETVPVLYEGPFDPEMLPELTSGPTTMADPDDIVCKFKGREGVVITPLVEEVDYRGNRVILKSVSPDYYEAM